MKYFPKVGYASYPVNRKLTQEELGYQLHQGHQTGVEPYDNLSVIRINSTYLECVDRWFASRGTLTAIALCGLGFLLSLLIQPVIILTPIRWIPNGDDIEAMLFSAIFTIPIWLLFVWMIRTEIYRYTHYPIRFNCRNRTVYVFGTNGPVFQAKWDDIFFTLGRSAVRKGSQIWEIRGHILDADGETVRATFSLPGSNTKTDKLKHGWEFFRRYMDDGPVSVYPYVFWCHDVATKRESYKSGLAVLFSVLGWFLSFEIIMSPLFIGASVGRSLAMRTSKIPAWPLEVEAQCTIDSFDPYLRDASGNPGKIPKEAVSARRSMGI